MAKLTQEQLQSAFSHAQRQRDQFSGGGGGSSRRFLKLSGGTSVLRFFPDANGLPFAYLRYHVARTESGSFLNALDLEFALEDETTRSNIEDRWSPNDSALVRAFGDPFTRLFYAMNGGGSFDENVQHDWLLPRNRYFYSAAIYRDDEWQVGLLERGPQFHEILEQFVVGMQVQEDDGSTTTVDPEAPDLFDEEGGPALRVMGNGEKGLRRRYISHTIDRNVPDGLVVTDEERADLVAFSRARYMSWQDKWQALRDHFGDETLDLHGLGLSKISEVLETPLDSMPDTE